MTDQKKATIVCPPLSDEEELPLSDGESEKPTYSYADWEQLVEDYFQPDNCSDDKHSQLVNYVYHIYSYWGDTDQTFAELQSDDILAELSLDDDYMDYIEDFLSYGDYVEKLGYLISNVVAHIRDGKTLLSRHMTQLDKLLDAYGDIEEEDEAEDEDEGEDEGEE